MECRTGRRKGNAEEWQVVCGCELSWDWLSCGRRRAGRSNGFEVRLGVFTAVLLNL